MSGMSGMIRQITLTEDQFALLYEYLDREHSLVWDPKVIGDTTKIGSRLWRAVQEIAIEQGFEPKHERVGEAHPVPRAGDTQ
jgi:hypothetical protein